MSDLIKTVFAANVRCYVTIEHPASMLGAQLLQLVAESIPEGGTYSYEIDPEASKEILVEFGSLAVDDPDILVIESSDPGLDAATYLLPEKIYGDETA